MINKFDHVGLAVNSAEETVALLSKLFGFEIKESRAEPEAGFKSTLISKEDVTLELIEPIGPQGMIQKFIEKRGAGLHHISIQVADLAEEMKRSGESVREKVEQELLPRLKQEIEKLRERLQKFGREEEVEELETQLERIRQI